MLWGRPQADGNYFGAWGGSQTELLAGIGGAWNINENFTLRLEYQKFFDVDVINLAVMFR